MITEFEDLFTAVSVPQDLSVHVPLTGVGWIGLSAATWQIDPSGQCYAIAAGNNPATNPSPSSADYRVTMGVKQATINGDYLRILCRKQATGSPAGNRYYGLRWVPSATSLELEKRTTDAGGTTYTLATYTIPNDTSPHEYALEMCNDGGNVNLRVFIEGVPQTVVVDNGSIGGPPYTTAGTVEIFANNTSTSSTKNRFLSLTVQTADASAISITPAAITLQSGQSHNFTTNLSCTFSITEGGDSGTLSNVSPTLVTYMAPATPGTYHLVASDVCDAATATITVIAAVACINFQARIARQANESDESCNAYGGITNLTACGLIAAGYYIITVPVVDLNGALPGESIRLKLTRKWDDPLNTSTDPVSLDEASIEYDVQ